MDEIVDIVDKDDKAVGKAYKKQAHIKGLLHRTVIGMIINSKGNFILVKQASDRQDAGQFVSPVGGHVRSKETVDKALKREALEEVGFSDFKYKFIGKAILNRKVLGRIENHYFIFHEIYSDGDINLNNEGVLTREFTEKQLREALINTPKIFGDALYFVFEKFYSYLLPTNYSFKY